MRIYRFRILVDHPSEAFRDIEIQSEQSFEDLHHAIKKAFAFIGQEMASFYVSDEGWDKGPEIPLADLGFAEEGEVPSLMKEVHISDHIRSTSQRFIYVYDFLHMWMFMVELIHAGDPVDGVEYPRVVMSMGQAPDEHSKEEDEVLEDPYAMEDEEQTYEDHDPDDEDHNEFGHGNIDDLGEEFR